MPPARSRRCGRDAITSTRSQKHRTTPNLPFSNPARYESPEADRLLEAAAVENDVKKRKALFREFQHLIDRDIPSIDLLSPLEVAIASRRLRDFTVGAEGVSSNWADAHLTN